MSRRPSRLRSQSSRITHPGVYFAGRLPDGLLARLASTGVLPKIFFINTSAEYWGGYAALTHTDLDGKRDLASLGAVRIYHLAGTQHRPGQLQLTDTGTADDSRRQH